MQLVRRGSLAVAVVALMLLAGCSGFFTSGDSIASMTISPGSFVSAAGQTVTLTASGTTVNGDSKDVTSTAKWSSSNASVLTVSGGTVTTVATGTATITAKPTTEIGISFSMRPTNTTTSDRCGADANARTTVRSMTTLIG